ncbi:DUF397 domain-containing protein [Amycolatopsis minnesotensis]|uniref:DUF397 domain-containing protein n=1 Tax=Amycolatopsis minnesotensis TaxID=337894 RepID=UPI0031D1DADC
MDSLANVTWRKSSYTDDDPGNGSTCVEAAALPDGRIAIRNSNHPDAGVTYFTRAEMSAWLKGVKAGEFDDLG